MQSPSADLTGYSCDTQCQGDRGIRKPCMCTCVCRVFMLLLFAGNLFFFKMCSFNFYSKAAVLLF